MAFNNENTARSNNNRQEAWKADGFLNFYLPSKDGSRRKLGAIPLRGAKPNEKQLSDAIKKDPDLVKRILASLVLEYNPAEQTDGAAFVI